MEHRKAHFIPGVIVTPLWILLDPKLTASEASVYSVIWNFSQGENDYHGTLQYLCQCARVQTPSYAGRVLRSLVQKGYIFKQTEMLLRGKKLNHYIPVPVVFDNVSQMNKPLSKKDNRIINNIYKENNIKERTHHDNRTNGQLAPNTQREDLLGQLL